LNFIITEKLCEGNGIAGLLITIESGMAKHYPFITTHLETQITTLQSMPLKQQVSHRVMNLLNGYLSLFQ
jgi:hypothetical protein